MLFENLDGLVGGKPLLARAAERERRKVHKLVCRVSPLSPSGKAGLLCVNE